MNKNISEKDMSKIQMGGRAQVATEYLDGKLDVQEANIITNLKNLFRSGTIDHGTLISGIAQLVALDDLKTRMKVDIRVAETAERKNG